MTITLHATDGRKMTCAHPHTDAKFVRVTGRRCECGADPLEVAGTGRGSVKTEHDMREEAACTRCRGVVGTLHVRFDTMWGITEDDAVLRGRPRVY